MAKTNKVSLSIRIPATMASAIETYATAHSTSKTDAICHYISLGMESESSPDASSSPATKADLLALGEALKTAIRNQPIAIAEAQIQPSSPLPAPTTKQEDPKEEAPAPETEDWRSKPLWMRILKR